MLLVACICCLLRVYDDLLLAFVLLWQGRPLKKLRTVAPEAVAPGPNAVAPGAPSISYLSLCSHRTCRFAHRILSRCASYLSLCTCYLLSYFKSTCIRMQTARFEHVTCCLHMLFSIVSGLCSRIPFVFVFFGASLAHSFCFCFLRGFVFCLNMFRGFARAYLLFLFSCVFIHMHILLTVLALMVIYTCDACVCV